MNIRSLIEKRNFKLDIVRKTNLHQVRTLDEYGEGMCLLYFLNSTITETLQHAHAKRLKHKYNYMIYFSHS